MKKLLIIDDEEDFVFMLQELFEMSNFAVIPANDGEEAINILASDDKIDMVLTDLFMPIRNGIDVIKEVNAHHSHIPVIVITAVSSNKEDVEQMVGEFSVVKSIFLKPATIKDLLNEVKQILSD